MSDRFRKQALVYLHETLITTLKHFNEKLKSVGRHGEFNSLNPVHIFPKIHSGLVVLIDKDVTLLYASRFDFIQTQGNKSLSNPLFSERRQNHQMMNGTKTTIVSAQYSTHQLTLGFDYKTEAWISLQKRSEAIVCVGFSNTQPRCFLPQIMEKLVIVKTHFTIGNLHGQLSRDNLLIMSGMQNLVV